MNRLRLCSVKKNLKRNQEFLSAEEEGGREEDLSAGDKDRGRTRIITLAYKEGIGVNGGRIEIWARTIVTIDARSSLNDFTLRLGGSRRRHIIGALIIPGTIIIEMSVFYVNKLSKVSPGMFCRHCHNPLKSYQCDILCVHHSINLIARWKQREPNGCGEEQRQD